MIIAKSNGTLEIDCAYGTDRVRTCDLRRAKAVLSQLSYNPKIQWPENTALFESLLKPVLVRFVSTSFLM